MLPLPTMLLLAPLVQAVRHQHRQDPVDQVWKLHILRIFHERTVLPGQALMSDPKAC